MIRAGQAWERRISPLIPGRLTLIVKAEEARDRPSAAVLRLTILNLETGKVIHRARWLDEEGSDWLKSQPATQRWRRVA